MTGTKADREARVDRLLIAPLAGLPRRRGVSAEAHEKMLHRLRDRLGALIDVAVGATFDWSGAMSSVKAEIHGIAAALSSIGGGMIDNAAKFVELNARKAGKSKAEAVRARKEYEIELQAGAESMGGSWYDRWLAGVKKQVALKGLDIDDQLAALDAAESASKRGGRKKSRSGSSDREGEQAARNLERIQRDFLTEQELLAVQYQEKLDGLAAARDRELLTEQEYQALKLQAQADFNAKSASLDRQALQEKLAAWSGGLGDLAGLMNTGNRKLFKIGKMAAIAQAVVDGWSAATSAWDKGMKIGGPPVAAAFSAMSIARTGAMIASIKSTQFDGGGGAGGGGSAGSGSGAAAAAQQPLQVRMLGLSPDSIISGADLGTLLNRLNDEAGDRGYNLLTRG
ncbi:hypothetical protein [Paracoccus sulfuroxidans]|uniref:Uncharacterized protein n=1 Tax=Paracoccus sulfuroxidans TaxID=384678 RepID=A0A562NRX2_9RHOB|nr:hypothetical protein [Paracoccus sulfuroxidans]TWI34915.1 hypothetical protein IQ24_01423 [Paracoccus sulfuroxidans]